MDKVKIGIIGGTGLDDPDIISDRIEKDINTPYGKPSDVLILGKIKGISCVLLARHGRKHTINPSNINYRANIWALKEQGCTHILATTACGSLQEDIHPGQIVLLDQFIDRTYKRESSFYDGQPYSPSGICHLQMDKPFCKRTRHILMKACDTLGFVYRKNGVVLTSEGPRFASRAESLLFQSWGAHVVNMTSVPEVCLAKEAGICYASIALPTDYDCWKDTGEPVNVSMVLKNLKENGERAKQIIVAAVPMIASEDWTETLEDCKELVKCSVLLP